MADREIDAQGRQRADWELRADEAALAVLAHGLLNSAAAVKSAAGMLRQRGVGQHDPVEGKYLEIIADQSAFIGGVLQDLVRGIPTEHDDPDRLLLRLVTNEPEAPQPQSLPRPSRFPVVGVRGRAALRTCLAEINAEIHPLVERRGSQRGWSDGESERYSELCAMEAEVLQQLAAEPRS